VEEISLRIRTLAAGGDGVGRDADGRVVFVPFTAPGDRVRVRIERARRRHAHGSVMKILEPGPGRVEPSCPVFGSCGGCSWQHLDYAVQLEAKAGIVRDALTRIGGFALPAPTIHASPGAYGYRGRTRVHVEAGRVGFRRRRSHELCAVTGCPILVPALDRELAALVADPPERDGEWELVAAGDETRAAAVADARGARLVAQVGEERLGHSPGVFSQSNALLLDVLAARVAEVAGSGARAVELYAGTGLFTLPLARRFAGVVAVEGHRGAVADLRENVSEAGLTNVDVRHASVDDALGALGGDAPDALVLDPPRQGLPPGAAAALVRVAAERIAYLSCDPATLARDLRAVADGGYAIESVEAFDLFPQTPHVEVLARLTR